MAPSKKIVVSLQHLDLDRRERLSKLSVLVADRDHRTASLVQRILFSFGFRKMDITTSGESALALLRSQPYDIIITEWNMVPVDGLTLVKAIRTAKDDERIRRDIPIIMLTARADETSVHLARDAGITEYVAKPFSAKTISNRIIQIIDNPRSFVESSSYVGPDRRRRGAPPPGVSDRRGKRKTKAQVTPANPTLQDALQPLSAAEIITDAAVADAQVELLKAESEFVDWARDDIALLRRAYANLKEGPAVSDAYRDMVYAAYAIKSQAGMFGYALGSEVAGLLVNYLDARQSFGADHLVVVGKHIDAINIIFKQKMKDGEHSIAKDMVASLKLLVNKLG